MKIEYIGQCGFIIKSDDISIAIDPVLSDLCENGQSIRLYPPAYPASELDVDYILCTHDHIDHMDILTITDAMNNHKDTRIVVPKGCIPMLSSIESSRIIGIGDKETVFLEDDKVSITGISTAHPVHQLDENGLDRNLAYAVIVGNKRLVHLGDTYYTERLEKALASLGKIDVLFLPINGTDEERTNKGIIGNLSSAEAAKLSAKLGCELTIPTHFDMVIGNTENPDNFVREIKATAPEAKYIIPKLLTCYSID